MKYEFIHENCENFKVAKICKVIKASRSGYYNYIKNRDNENQRKKDLLEAIKKEWFESNKTYGSPRIYHSLKRKGIKCYKNEVAKLMAENGMKSKICKKYKATTNSKHNLPIADNILNRKFNPKKLNEVWASDITYIPTEEGWLYLAVVMDLCNREIIGFSLAKHMRKELVIQALNQAIIRRNAPTGVLHHSDRGVQYASYDYQNLLTENQFICSMSRKGNCFDNAVVESFNGTLKQDLVNSRKYKTREEAKLSIFEYIETKYNRTRIHSTLGYLTPIEYAEKVA